MPADDTQLAPVLDPAVPEVEGTVIEEKAAPVVEVTREAVPAAFRGDIIRVREERVPVRREFELREVPNGTGGVNLQFTGFACVTDARYLMEDWLGEFGETVSKGAFKKTLDEGADVAWLLNHRGMTFARTKSGTMKLSEVTEPGLSPVIGVTGLHTEALLDLGNPQVLAIRSAVERGDLDEMSFAFRVMRQEWNDTYDERYINEVSVDKGDVSLVNYGANPHTGGTVDLRQRLDPRDHGRESAALRATVALAFQEIRAGKTISADTASKLAAIHPHLDATGDASDSVRGIITDLIAMSTGGDNGGCGCCGDCTDDCDGSCCDDCNMGTDPAESSLAYQGLFFDASRDAALAEVEAMRYHRRAA
jgi:HK97 family phage prohead protease